MGMMERISSAPLGLIGAASPSMRNYFAVPSTCKTSLRLLHIPGIELVTLLISQLLSDDMLYLSERKVLYASSKLIHKMG